MEKMRQPMNFPRFMVLFHLSFLLLGLLSSFMIVTNIISLDWSAFMIIMIAVLVNAFFEVYWIDEAGRTRVEKPKPVSALKRVFPMVSFVVPAHNNEQDIAQCVNSLLKCAAEYRGPSEIIVVDDGSTDNTLDVAWATINSKRGELMQIRSTAVKHMSSLGKDEAVRAGVNKAMGEFIAVIDASISCDPAWFSNLVDYMSATGQKVVSSQVQPLRATLPPVPTTITLYRADVLRRQLNEKPNIQA